jgi:hypothetical protein
MQQMHVINTDSVIIHKLLVIDFYVAPALFRALPVLF